MAYTTFDDFPVGTRSKISAGLWGNSTTSTTSRDADILTAAEQAQGIIDSRLAPLYPGAIPFSSATLPRLISSISLHLTLWFLIGAQQVRGTAYQTNYEWAMDTLDKISAGEMRIYSESEADLLNPYDSNYGIESDFAEYYDEDELTYRAFPRTMMPAVPSTADQVFREDD